MIIEEDEALGLAALDEARAGSIDIVPDTRSRNQDGEYISWVSARAIDEAAEAICKKHEIGIDFEGSELTGPGRVTTSWTWRWGQWRSAVTTIDVMVEMHPPLAPATQAAVTTGRKIFLRELLQIRTAIDLEGELARAADRARDVLWHATEELLTTFCNSRNKDQAMVISTFLGWAGNEAPTYQMLNAAQRACLMWRLTMQINASVDEPPDAVDLTKVDTMSEAMQ